MSRATSQDRKGADTAPVSKPPVAQPPATQPLAAAQTRFGHRFGDYALSAEDAAPIQRKANGVEDQTGLPAALKSGVEALSGQSLNDVNVHPNSTLPAQIPAMAYAQGADIHLGPGEEQHLPHEAWHVVQQ